MPTPSTGITRNCQRAARAIAAVLLVAAAWTGAPYAADLVGGPGCAFELQQTTVPVSLTQNGGQVAALQFDLLYDAASLNPATPLYVGASDHQLASSVVTPGQLRIVLHSPTNSLLPDGLVVDAPFTVSAGAPAGPLPLPFNATVLATIGTMSLAPGSTTSGEVEVAVVTAPMSATVCNGASASLDVAVSGPPTPPPTYQWKKDGIDIPGETSAMLNVTPVESADVGLYSAAVSNACGMATSGAAVLDVAGVCEPTDLSSYDPGLGGSLNLTWTPNPSSDVNSYRLFWGTDEGGPYPSQQDFGVVADTELPNLTNGTRYYFKLVAQIVGPKPEQSPFSNETNAVPTAGGLDLPQAAEYGYQTPTSADISHPDVVTYRFPARPGDTTLWYDVYDIGVDEASISLNGVSVLDPVATTAAGNWAASPRTLLMPDSLVFDSEPNVLTFDNLYFPPGSEDTWGARNVSLKLPAPATAAAAWSQTVDLTITPPRVEPSLAGYSVFRSETQGFVPNAANRVAIGAQGPLYRDESGLINGTTYYYVLRPVDTISNPGFDSVEVSATPSNASVTPIVDLRVSKSGADDTLLEWSPAVTERGVQFYKIYHASTPSAVATSFTGATTVSGSFVRPGDQSDGAPHFYLVGVVDNGGLESVIDPSQ